MRGNTGLNCQYIETSRVSVVHPLLLWDAVDMYKAVVSNHVVTRNHNFWLISNLKPCRELYAPLSHAKCLWRLLYRGNGS